VIVWLWDAPGPNRCARGVTVDYARAQEAARACLTADQAATALVQAAELVAGSDVLDPYYARFGRRWQARRTRSGEIRQRFIVAERGEDQARYLRHPGLYLAAHLDPRDFGPVSTRQMARRPDRRQGPGLP
jgi:hypothetical protein